MLAYSFRVSRGLTFAISALFALPLMGCQNYIFQPFNLDAGNSVSVDAKQRLVFVTERGGKHGNRRVVCAEPSPDALSAIATAGSAAITFPQVLPGGQTSQASASGGFSQNEAAASIGLRTQAIQLLRDSLYRACEAYMNGVIDRTEYTVILMNIDRVMISIVGIDAIGGGPVGPAAAVHATAAPPKVTVAKDDGSVVVEGGGGSTGADSKFAQVHSGVDSKSAGAIRDIVGFNARHSSFPAVCMSLLASGDLDTREPGQRAVFDACKYLVSGAARRILEGPG